MTTRSSKALRTLARRRSVVRSKDFVAIGISRRELAGLVAAGVVRREGRGIHSLAGHEATEKHSVAVAVVRVPKGVVCLLSALVFHGITTQNPWEVWMAVDIKARKPSLESPKLRVVRFSGSALREGVEAHTVEGVAVRVYSVAKTVADLFKYRNKVGTDVAIEALRAALRGKQTTRKEIVRFAKVCRVLNIMRPYLESL